MAIRNIVSALSVANGVAFDVNPPYILGLDNTYLQTDTGTIPANSFKNLASTPFEIISGGAGGIVFPITMILWVDYNSIDYADGSNVVWAYTDNFGGVAEFASSTAPAAFFKEPGSSTVTSFTQSIFNPQALINLIEKNLSVVLAGAIDFTAGDSPVNYFLRYARINMQIR